MQNPLLADRSIARERTTDLIVSIATLNISGILSCVAKKLGGKAIWLSLLVALMFSLSYSPQAKAQSCNADTLCAWTLWSTTTMSVPIVVNGDTCNWSFTYKFRTCGPPFNIQLKIISWSDPDTTCVYYSYLDSLANANINAYWSIIYDVLDQANSRIGEKLFLNIRLANPPSSDFDCLSSSGCATSGQGYVSVLTFYDKCIEFIDAQGGGIIWGGCPGITYVVDCQSQQCCILIRKMCYDNGTIRVCETTLQGSGSVQCSGNATFTPPGGCNILRRSGCIPRCP